MDSSVGRSLISAVSAMIVLFTLWGLNSSLVWGEAVEKKALETKPSPIVINSKTLEVDNTSKIVTFTGEVDAKKDDMTIECDKMLVYYERLESQGKKDSFNTKIDKIVATGQVRIRQQEGATATAEKAVYFQDDEKLVLTGRPVVKQGNDFVEGDRITLFLKENRSVVEGSDKKKVRATIFPKTTEN